MIPARKPSRKTASTKRTATAPPLPKSVGPLFHASHLAHLGVELGFTSDELLYGLGVLDDLRARRADGSLARLSETRVEQSFNEQLFSKAFGYRTYLSHGAGEFELLPKKFEPDRRLYNDFALGFFSALRGLDAPPAIVSCELKSPGADLDAPQASYPGRITPVQQAHATAGAEVLWVLVSNFDEIRLYSKGDLSRFERVVLSDLLTPWDFQRALVVLGRRSLLGEVGTKSPLHRLLSGDLPLMLTQGSGRVQLVHESRPNRRTKAEFPLHAMHDALLNTMNMMPANWPRRDANWSPQLKEDRLVVETLSKGGPCMRLEFTRSGVLRISEYLTEGDTRLLNAGDIAEHVACFLTFASRIGKLYKCPAEVSWTMHDVGGAHCNFPDGWVGGGALVVKRQFPSTVGASRAPFTDLVPGKRGELTTAAVRELLYPCEFLVTGSQAILRLTPSEESVERLLKSRGTPDWL